MRNQKGITLIALVITIIVLLILAGVSIAMLTGQNGILTQANNAKVATAKANAEEALKLAVAEILSNKLDPTYVGGENVISQANLQSLTKKQNSNLDVSCSTEQGDSTKYFTVTIDTKYVFYVVTETGAISETAPAQTPTGP